MKEDRGGIVVEEGLDATHRARAILLEGSRPSVRHQLDQFSALAELVGIVTHVRYSSPGTC